MFRFVVLICCIFCVFTAPARAGQAEAREVARLNNCAPKKIEVMKNLLGNESRTVYQVSCNLPKMAGSDAAAGPDSVLVACDQSLCTLIRPVAAEKK